MNLNTEQAGKLAVYRIIVGNIAHQNTVDIMLKMIPVRNDMAGIPVIRFY